MTTTRGAPKPRQRPGKAPSNANGSSEETPAGTGESRSVGGHPMWGHTPVATVSVVKIRFRSGNPSNPPIKLALAPHAPHEIVDSSQLLQRYGMPGRYQLTPLTGAGHLAAGSQTFDVPDETGNLDLVAPMPDGAPGAPGPAASPAGDVVGLYKDIAERAERSRSNDFGAFVELMKATMQKPGDSGLAPFLQAELATARARINDLEGKIERQSVELLELRMRLSRRQSSGGDDGAELLTAAVAAGAERMGFLPPGTAAKIANKAVPAAAPGGAPAGAPAAQEEPVGLPTAEQFAQAVKDSGTMGGIPPEIIRRMVRLRKASALPDDLWQIVEPIAEQLGLL